MGYLQTIAAMGEYAIKPHPYKQMPAIAWGYIVLAEAAIIQPMVATLRRNMVDHFRAVLRDARPSVCNIGSMHEEY